MEIYSDRGILITPASQHDGSTVGGMTHAALKYVFQIHQFL